MNGITLSTIIHIQRLNYNLSNIFNEKDLQYLKKLIINNNNTLIKLNDSINNFINFNILNYYGIIKLIFLIFEILNNDTVNETYNVNLFSIIYFIIIYIINTNIVYLTITEKEQIEKYIYQCIINFKLTYLSYEIVDNEFIEDEFIVDEMNNTSCCNFLF